jgi:hypothetical protein
MKKILCAIVLGVSLACHAGDGLFWSANTNGTGVYFFRSAVSTPGAAQAVRAGTAWGYLRLDNGSVVELSAAQKAAQDAAEAKESADAQVAAAILAAVAASNAAVQYAADMLSYSNRLSDIEEFDDKTKLWFKALVQEFNVRMPENKITFAQLKARVESIR